MWGGIRCEGRRHSSSVESRWDATRSTCWASPKTWRPQQNTLSLHRLPRLAPSATTPFTHLVINGVELGEHDAVDQVGLVLVLHKQNNGQVGSAPARCRAPVYSNVHVWETPKEIANAEPGAWVRCQKLPHVEAADARVWHGASGTRTTPEGLPTCPTGHTAGPTCARSASRLLNLDSWSTAGVEEGGVGAGMLTQLGVGHKPGRDAVGGLEQLSLHGLGACSTLSAPNCHQCLPSLQAVHPAATTRSARSAAETAG